MQLRLHGDCEACPLQGGTIVNGYGPKNAKIAIVGEAPGGFEARIGRPFVGPSGNLIRAMLRGCGVDDENEVYWTNAVLTRGSETANPKIGTIRACNHRLRDELAQMQPQKILTLGGPALTAILSSPKMLQITKYRGLGMMVGIGGRPTFTVPSYHPAAILRQQDLYRDLAYDLEKVLTRDAPEPDIAINTIIPWTVQDAVRELEDLLHASLVSCDIETTGLDPLDDLMTCIGFAAYDADGGYTSLVINMALLEFNSVRTLIGQNLEVNRPLIFHNGKYDLKFLERYCERSLQTPLLGDTMLLHYTSDERTGGAGNTEERGGAGSIKTRVHSLKTIARVRYDIVYSYDFNWDTYFTTEDEFVADQMVLDLFKYNARDCAYTLRLWRDLVEEADVDQLRLHSHTLIPGSIALRKVEQRGIYVDLENLVAVKAKFLLEQGRLQSEIMDLALELTDAETVEKIAGKDPDHIIKPSSPKQVQDLIATIGIDTKFLQEKVHSVRTKWSGTDKNSLHKMALQYPEHHPVRVLLQDIMAYRVIKASVATFLSGLEARIGSDGRVHGSFLLHGTVTGRLSSIAPNMQNFPNYGSGGSGGSGFASAVQNIDVVALSKSIRNSLCATPGYTLVEADFSQLELRILAYYCDDDPLKQIFINGEDIHTRVASEIFGKPPETISGEERRHGKVVDFGIVYGRSAGQIVGGPEMDIVVERGGERWTIQQAEGFLRRFFDGFPKVEPWLRNSRMKAHTDHAVYSPTGRVRRLPLVLQDGHAERQAINSPIQSLASDICLHALTRLVDTLPEGAYVISTIHDSILFEIRDDLLACMIPFIRSTMEKTNVISTPIPMIVDFKSSKKWGETQKIKEEEVS